MRHTGKETLYTNENEPPRSAWQLLLRWRWWLAGILAVAFAVGRFIEALLLHQPLTQASTLLDVLLWGFLGGLAVWFSLTWASRQEQRYQSEVERSLQRQQELNAQLQRSNQHLALLSEVNQQIADAATLDEILDGALAFPCRLVRAQAAALWLHDAGGDVLTRVTGAREDEIEARRASFGLRDAPTTFRHLTAPGDADGLGGGILQLPLQDAAGRVGWIELFLARRAALAEDERALLETIANEIGEGIVSTRRRSREERALFELEQAIAEERARIARDIHDGLAQMLAFRRMRIELWLDWIEEDPVRLRSELISLKQVLREQIAELRRAIFALRPVQFDELGFVGGLHRFVTEFASQQAWQVEVDLSGLPAQLHPRLEATCFRVVQESLTNAAKHARPSRVTVRAEQVDDGLHLIIRDDGVGFNPGSVDENGERLGVRQMRERLHALNGRLTLLSQPGEGTEVRAWLPLHPER